MRELRAGHSFRRRSGREVKVSLEANHPRGARTEELGTLTVRVLPKLSPRAMLFDDGFEPLLPRGGTRERERRRKREQPRERSGPGRGSPADPTRSFCAGALSGTADVLPSGSSPGETPPLNLQLNWRDTDGLEDVGGHRIRVEPLEDQKPHRLHSRASNARLVILADRYRELRNSGRGRLRRQAYWLRVDRSNSRNPLMKRPHRGIVISLEVGGPNQRRISESVVHFSPRPAGYSNPSNLSVTSLRGRLTSRGAGRSLLRAHHGLHILTKDEQAQLLKEQVRPYHWRTGRCRPPRAERLRRKPPPRARRELRNLQNEANQERLNQQEAQRSGKHREDG